MMEYKRVMDVGDDTTAREDLRKLKLNKISLSDKIVLVERMFDVGMTEMFLKRDIKQAVQNSERRIKEVIQMEWVKGMEYVLKEIEEIFLEEMGEKLI